VKFPAGDLGKILPLEMPLKSGILGKISLGRVLDKVHGSILSKVVALKMSFLCKITDLLPECYFLVVACQMERK